MTHVLSCDLNLSIPPPKPQLVQFICLGTLWRDNSPKHIFRLSIKGDRPQSTPLPVPRPYWTQTLGSRKRTPAPSGHPSAARGTGWSCLQEGSVVFGQRDAMLRAQWTLLATTPASQPPDRRASETYRAQVTKSTKSTGKEISIFAIFSILEKAKEATWHISRNCWADVRASTPLVGRAARSQRPVSRGPEHLSQRWTQIRQYLTSSPLIRCLEILQKALGCFSRMQYGCFWTFWKHKRHWTPI